jgi:hypothetical protein
MWTKFWDMHSGGSQKEEQQFIFIEASEDEAKAIFYNRFGHNPERVTCTCCGDDYSISEDESLEQITAYHRNCAYGENGYLEYQNTEYPLGNYQTLEQFLSGKTAIAIYANEIKPEEKIGDVPEQGYVWK